MATFADKEPLRLLAHNLDFWIPAVTAMLQARLTEHSEIDKGPIPSTITLEDGSVLDGAVPGHPRAGGQIWFGEDDARVAVGETVEAADRTGQLRSIVDAVKSNRVADDFSSRCSYAVRTSSASSIGSATRSLSGSSSSPRRSPSRGRKVRS